MLPLSLSFVESQRVERNSNEVVGMGEDTPSETHVRKERSHMPGMTAGDQGRGMRPPSSLPSNLDSVVFGNPPNTSAKLHFAMELVTSGMQMENPVLAHGAWEISAPQDHVLPQCCVLVRPC